MRATTIIALIAVLTLAGCGTNESTGLDEVTLLPDLQVVDWDEDTQLVFGEAGTVEMTVANRGGTDARPFTARVVITWTVDLTTRQAVGTIDFPLGMISGGAETVKVPVQMPVSSDDITGGFFTSIYLQVDHREEIRESDETNNVLSAQIFLIVPSDDGNDGGGFDGAISVN